tara:strand:- start:17492 stop:17746 length:255 start_codon:yes stop_codon:yes gene_type:complete
MTNNDVLKKQIIYRSSHRGTKEMDIILGAFVNKYIDLLNEKNLKDLNTILSLEDEILYDWYFNKRSTKKIVENEISAMLRKFKL